tara:strand:+ start:2569 stop:2913 length:345 start_codon:yes stop_codon:yes gene_type:complete
MARARSPIASASGALLPWSFQQVVAAIAIQVRHLAVGRVADVGHGLAGVGCQQGLRRRKAPGIGREWPVLRLPDIACRSARSSIGLDARVHRAVEGQLWLHEGTVDRGCGGRQA